MIRQACIVLICLVNFGCFIHASAAQELIPREVLFQDPQIATVRLSPDGHYLSYLAPHQGVLNIWVAPVDDPRQARVVTQARTRGIRKYRWAMNNHHILYELDHEGNENWQLYQVDITTLKHRDLSQAPEATTYVLATSHQHPDKILMALNKRHLKWHDIYEVDLLTGARSLVFENNRYADFEVDDTLTLRFGTVSNAQGDYVVEDIITHAEVLTIPYEDTGTTDLIEFTDKNSKLLLLDSRERDTQALVEFDLATRKYREIAAYDTGEIQNILLDPKTHDPLAAMTYDLHSKWHVIDPKIQEDLHLLTAQTVGTLKIVSQNLSNTLWVIAEITDTHPIRYSLYDRLTHKKTFLFDTQPQLGTHTLAPTQPVVIQSRDGLRLPSYLTRPMMARAPLVLLVHGGPAARTYWEFDRTHQWLANRGYAVLSVNYRGSSGFGKRFLNAGNGEWGRKMQDDLIDAVNWAIDNEITWADKIVVMGGSYGGYAVLSALTTTPEVFQAGIDIVGVSNLETLMKTIPPYWEPLYQHLSKRIGGNPKTESGRQFLASRSPVNFADRITKPLLIFQGANDPRVKQSESEQIVMKMKELHIPVTYVLFPDEGHGFKRPVNRQAFTAITEAFLAKVLGGRLESIKEQDIAASTALFKHGQDYLESMLP